MPAVDVKIKTLQKIFKTCLGKLNLDLCTNCLNCWIFCCEQITGDAYHLYFG